MVAKNERTVMTVLIGQRKEAAVNVQKVLTAWGCMIKTRLGIHDGVLDKCADSGLLILELVGKSEDQDEMLRKLNLIQGVHAKLVHLTVDGDK